MQAEIGQLDIFGVGEIKLQQAEILAPLAHRIDMGGGIGDRRPQLIIRQKKPRKPQPIGANFAEKIAIPRQIWRFVAHQGQLWLVRYSTRRRAGRHFQIGHNSQQLARRQTVISVRQINHIHHARTVTHAAGDGNTWQSHKRIINKGCRFAVFGARGVE